AVARWADPRLAVPAAAAIAGGRARGPRDALRERAARAARLGPRVLRGRQRASRRRTARRVHLERVLRSRAGGACARAPRARRDPLCAAEPIRRDPRPERPGAPDLRRRARVARRARRRPGRPGPPPWRSPGPDRPDRVNRRRLLAAAAPPTAAAACGPLAVPPGALAGASPAARLLAAMSPAARAGQMMSVAFHGTTITPSLEAMIRGRGVGGVILYSENFDGDALKLKTLIADLSRIASDAKVVPPFFSIDQEGGAVVRIGRGATVLPGNMALAATPDPADSVRKAVAITARD